MKGILFYLALLCPGFLLAQHPIDTSDQEMISMSDTRQDRYNGDWVYFQKGADQPFTGILYATYPNGSFESVQEFSNGRGNGRWVNYYPDGTVREAGTYVDDRVEGPVKMYYPNGQLQAEGRYREWRVRVGFWTYFDEEGQFIRQENYGREGDFRDVEAYYNRGEISRSFYERIRAAYR